MTDHLFDLSGKTALVTGSSRGIGKAVATAMARLGANVVISSRKQPACEAVAAEVNARGGGRAIPVPANIASRQELRELVDRTCFEFGHIDILVCNAASNPYFGPMQEIQDAQFEKILANNVLSNHWLIQLTAPAMRERRDGAIVIVSSIGGYRGSAGLGAYNVSKAADFQLARNYACEFGSDNIRVNCIAPGLIRTDFARVLLDDEGNAGKALAGTPLARFGEPEDVAGAAVFLAAPAGRYITGQTIIVDGGATITLGGI